MNYPEDISFLPKKGNKSPIQGKEVNISSSDRSKLVKVGLAQVSYNDHDNAYQLILKGDPSLTS